MATNHATADGGEPTTNDSDEDSLGDYSPVEAVVVARGLLKDVDTDAFGPEAERRIATAIEQTGNMLLNVDAGELTDHLKTIDVDEIDGE